MTTLEETTLEDQLNERLDQLGEAIKTLRQPRTRNAALRATFRSQAIVTGTELCGRIAQQFIFASIWFETMPLPDDQWEFTFKNDVAHVVDDIIKECEAAA